MLPLLAERVAPGPQRDHLVYRHFEIEGLIVLQALLDEPSRDRRREALSRVSAWLDEFYTEGVEARLPVFHRVCYALARTERLDELRELMQFRESGAKPQLVVHDGRMFVAYPYFRDPQVPIPDERFEVSDRVKTWRHLDLVEWSGPVMHLEAQARLTRAGSVVPEASLVLRLRGSGVEHVLPCRQEARPGTNGGVRARRAISMCARRPTVSP